MKQAEDTKTLDMIGGVPGRRGRPPAVCMDGWTDKQKDEARKAAAAARKAAQRARAAESGRTTLTVTLSADLVAAINKAIKFKDETQSQAVERILRNQLLRKR